MVVYVHCIYIILVSFGWAPRHVEARFKVSSGTPEFQLYRIGTDLDRSETELKIRLRMGKSEFKKTKSRRIQEEGRKIKGKTKK